MEHESGLIPSRIQSDLAFNSVWAFSPYIGGYALGLAQWDSGRRVNLLTKAQEETKHWCTVSFQLDFAWYHDGSDSGLLKRMSQGIDINSLAVHILEYWERAGTKDDPIEQVKWKTSANNWYKRLMKGSLGGGSANIGGGKIDILAAFLGQEIYGGQCYGLPAYYVEKLGGPALIGSGFMYAELFASDYDCESYVWEVIFDPKFSDIKPGDVINWYAGNPIAPGIYGHTGIIASVEGDGAFTTYEQNAEQGQISARYSRQ